MCVTSIVDSLHAGYPDEAPRTGYSSLLAFNGLRVLTTRKIGSVGTRSR
jgi:hypothetical protein